jgi:hypothetical protein
VKLDDVPNEKALNKDLQDTMEKEKESSGDEKEDEEEKKEIDELQPKK